MRPVSKKKVFRSISLLAVLALSSLVAIPFAHAQSSTTSSSSGPSTGTTIPATPSLSKITLSDYGGSDQQGIADLVAGKNEGYDFAVTPSEAATIPQGYSQYETPAAWYGLEINPTNTTGAFNPFQFQQVRYALNYLVGRNYFVGNLLGGNAIPTFTVFGGEPDELVISSATAAYSNITDSITTANSTIYSALHSVSGVTYKSTATPRWSYDGKPITVTVFDRTDDPVRHAYDGYLASQLQQVGFAVNSISGTLSNAETTVLGAESGNATWDIYPASYSFTYSYYDEGFAELYAPIAGAIPASDSKGLAFGTYNDTAKEQPSTVALLNSADQYAIDFFNTNFSSFAQRNADLGGLVAAGVQASVVIGLAQSLEPYVTAPALTGVSTNFVNDPLLNALSFLTMNSASGSTDIGVRHIAESSLNPVGGYTDSYSAVWTEAVANPPVFYQPSTGYPYPVGWSFSVKADSPNASTPIPSTAVVMNASQDKFVNVAKGAMAKTAVVANFAPLLTESWQDGQPLTLADILYSYILAGEVTQNTNSPVYDGYSSAVFGPSWTTLVGLQIINSTSVEVYSTFYYPDQFFAGVNAAGSLFAFTPTTGAQGVLPWQVYAGMANLVSSGKDVWSNAAATSKNLPWLSLVNPTDVANLKAVLSSYASSSFVPPEFASLQSLTGVSFVNSSSAAAGYNAAVGFIGQYGTTIIGNGQYILSQYSPSTSPAYAILTKNPAFKWGTLMAPQLGSSQILVSQQATISGIVNPGQTLSVTALQTVEGSRTTSPAANATVTLQLISNGVIAYQKNATSNSAGLVTFTLPTTLKAGQYVVSLWTSTAASTLYDPLMQSVQVSTTVVSSTSSGTSTIASGGPGTSTGTFVGTTTATTSATSSTSSSTPATGTSATTYLVLGVVAIVVIVVVAAAFMRRKP